MAAPTAARAPGAPASALDRTARLDLLALVVGTVAIRLPAVFAERHLTFDDGVFGASAVAMRHGGEPFKQVFSSQGPLFLPLLWLVDLLGLRRLDSPRLLAVLAGVALVVAVYLIGRALTDRTGALLAAGLTSVSASVLWVTGPLAADGVALALATVAMLLVLRWREDVTIGRAIWIGIAVSAAISVKALLGVVLLPVVVVLLAGRKLAPIVAGALAAAAFHFALWLPWGPSRVWDQAYQYHLDVAGSRTPGANLSKTLSTLGDRDLPVVAAVVLALAAAAWTAYRRRATSAARSDAARADEPLLDRLVRWAQHPDVLLGLWLAAVVLMLVTEHPMWRPHVAHLIPPLALLAVRHRPPAAALLVAAVLVVPYHVVHAWGVLDPTPFTGSAAQVEAALRSMPRGALAISDDPGIVYRAGRRTTNDLVDTSILRIETGRMDVDSVMASARDRRVCAVVVRSAVRWGSFRSLPSRLAAAGYHVVLPEDPDGRVMYGRAPCFR
jgi:4-amino-4-deoxy-L-arabinose transferase-like glycosyltransferase